MLLIIYKLSYVTTLRQGLEPNVLELSDDIWSDSSKRGGVFLKGGGVFFLGAGVKVSTMAGQQAVKPRGPVVPANRQTLQLECRLHHHEWRMQEWLEVPPIHLLIVWEQMGPGRPSITMGRDSN
ncbi:hypothetical protein HNY73_008127 [Argiope bruennichi]|uniref:Uncharacterized protein n=1 Tax=Argiope bruennichi TaxID=94029 RepID=A0A8T0F5K9_ARGBR|nr:hypothetical protein HNY73_008127 [Argiope bruennichi]